MKKKLEAELISIAHRVLQMKSKSDLKLLQVEAGRLYEKLSVLCFVEDHFSEVKPTIGVAEAMTIVDKTFDAYDYDLADQGIAMEDNQAQKAINRLDLDEDSNELELIEETDMVEIAPVIDNINSIDLSAVPTEKLKTVADFELSAHENQNISNAAEKAARQISFEEILGEDYSNTLFVKADTAEETPNLDFELPIVSASKQGSSEKFAIERSTEASEVLTQKMSSGFNIGLNDRIAFVKHLFANSNEDYVRVMNQLITFESFDEARNFISNFVKPDYDNWLGKEEYEQRFIEIIERKLA